MKWISNWQANICAINITDGTGNFWSAGKVGRDIGTFPLQKSYTCLMTSAKKKKLVCLAIFTRYNYTTAVLVYMPVFHAMKSSVINLH